MRELLITRIKEIVKTASFGTMRWGYLYHRLNTKKLSSKQLKDTKLIDLFDFDSYTDEALLRHFECVLYRSLVQM